jgi:hypothetical protein
MPSYPRGWGKYLLTSFGWEYKKGENVKEKGSKGKEITG